MEESQMSKTTITKLFVGSLIAIVAGVIVVAFGVGMAFANGAFTVSLPGVTGVDTTRFTGGVVLSLTLGVVAIVGGAMGQLVAWIGAVINTARLEDKTWFILLLVLGLLSFGFIAMLIYVLAGPDGMKAAPEQRAYSGTPA
jgi:hypothetical protein